MIQLINDFWVIFRYLMGLVVSDYNKRLIQLSMIQLRSGADTVLQFSEEVVIEWMFHYKR